MRLLGLSTPLSSFKQLIWGTEWGLLIHAWLKFEQNSQFVANGRLGTQHRPDAVGDWIQRARPSSYHPKINDIQGYGTKFSLWWQSLQPDWRNDDADDALPRSREDWEDIRRPGINGIMSVAAALFFWGYVERNKGESARSAWLNAVDDVVYVLNQLA